MGLNSLTTAYRNRNRSMKLVNDLNNRKSEPNGEVSMHPETIDGWHVLGWQEVQTLPFGLRPNRFILTSWYFLSRMRTEVTRGTGSTIEF